MSVLEDNIQIAYYIKVMHSALKPNQIVQIFFRVSDKDWFFNKIKDMIHFLIRFLFQN